MGWRGEHDAWAFKGYGAAILALGMGAAAGRLGARPDVGPFLTAASAAVVVGSVLIFPFYSNAEAATGVQLVALSGLLLAGVLHSPKGARARTWIKLLAAVAGVLGVLLAARSQAASVLVLLVIVIIALALRSGFKPSRRALRVVGQGGIAAAVLAVLALGGSSSWPRWMSHPESLSGARHRLWRDALDLWREDPVFGSGFGSFLQHSETARSAPHLYAAHSSILQVAAELGAIGVLLFLAVLVAGAFTASQGDPARGLIGVTAWCALAIHSMIDHLYEFPIVCLLAGLVIGWAGSRGDVVGAAEPPPPRPLSTSPDPRRRDPA